MERARSVIVMVAGLLLLVSTAQADPSAESEADCRAHGIPQPSFEYRAHPESRRGFDRVRRAVPPRVEVDAGYTRDLGGALPDGVYVDAWRQRRPDRRRR